MEQELVTAPSPFPTETIELPSKGLFYQEGSPLRSGTVDIYYMTAKHEDILTSTNLIQKGIVLDKFLDAIIATKGVKSADLLIGDLNAVMVAARILGYGKDYEINIECPSCGNAVTQTVNLAELEQENVPDGSSKEFNITLPMSKADVRVKLLTRQDELDIDKEMKSMKKINSDIDTESTTRLKKMILSVNGETSSAKIWQFVDNMLVKDARYLRDTYKTKVPDINFNIPVECSCGANQKMRLPIGVTFFWPDSRV
jgi:hypothetical protein